MEERTPGYTAARLRIASILAPVAIVLSSIVSDGPSGICSAFFGNDPILIETSHGSRYPSVNNPTRIRALASTPEDRLLSLSIRISAILGAGLWMAAICASLYLIVRRDRVGLVVGTACLFVGCAMLLYGISARYDPISFRNATPLNKR
jgi:hypothetical protein